MSRKAQNLVISQEIFVQFAALMASIAGQLDPLTIKISALPQAQEIENGWQEFTVDIGSAIVTVKVRPRIWRNLVEGSQRYSNWMAIIIGKMGKLTDTGFILEQPGIQIFESKTPES